MDLGDLVTVVANINEKLDEAETAVFIPLTVSTSGFLSYVEWNASMLLSVEETELCENEGEFIDKVIENLSEILEAGKELQNVVVKFGKTINKPATKVDC